MTGAAPLRIWLGGPHAARSPLAYPALAPALTRAGLARAERPGTADLLAFAHILDLQTAPGAAIAEWRARRLPVLLLSEEPFWDTIWTGRPLDRRLTVDTEGGAVPALQISHQTSPAFRAAPEAGLPYFLLTDDSYTDRYARLFARNAALDEAAWATALATRPLEAAMMFERRPEPLHDVAWPEAGLAGLCAWRTRMAEALAARRPPGAVALLGRSWQGGSSRFSLEDWHADKLARLDGQARVIGALENTHQPDYLTEKLFDAFACGGVPVYLSAPGHAARRLGLPSGAWIDGHGLTPEAAAARIALRLAAPPRGEAVEAYRAAQARLAALFGPGLADRRTAARADFAAALRAELERAMEEAPRPPPPSPSPDAETMSASGTAPDMDPDLHTDTARGPGDGTDGR